MRYPPFCSVIHTHRCVPNSFPTRRSSDLRRELVELLDLEVAAGFESNKGAMERLGVENVQAKLQEIESERNKRRNNSVVSYGNEDVNEKGGENEKDDEQTALQ